MKNAVLILTFLFCTGSMLSCNSSRESASTALRADSVLTGIERGPCFGKCPEYKAVIYTSGFAEYFGGRNNPLQGNYQCRLKPEELSTVKALMNQYSIAEADSEYVNKYLADFPAYWLMVSDKKGSRRILVNHQEPPANIRDYTYEIDKFVGNLLWKEMKRSTDQ
jgi:hypothetical protein